MRVCTVGRDRESVIRASAVGVTDDDDDDDGCDCQKSLDDYDFYKSPKETFAVDGTVSRRVE